MEQVIIEGLEVSTVIGVYEWERTKPQTLYVDLVINADLNTACMSDDVSDTIDYAKVAEFLVAVAANARFELLEALAQKFCDQLFANFSLRQIDVTITKPNILPNARKVAVRLIRKA
ncbi:dihydroneopterin aldolase [Alteromonas oceanisediminis]|uniref:dihydroneopterin aldolase n=1 Tax=Alteromonas oceanisediminis TaxID=2836180 RepID=UPI001BDA3830|nr:dihydroneopterin aldolase [Alteromonas oceanisediminis]MBT0585302.1 dihydroneopterin aldolase [Alteromonas oceanisediminis]